MRADRAVISPEGAYGIFSRGARGFGCAASMRLCTRSAAGRACTSADAHRSATPTCLLMCVISPQKNHKDRLAMRQHQLANTTTQATAELTLRMYRSDHAVLRRQALLAGVSAPPPARERIAPPSTSSMEGTPGTSVSESRSDGFDWSSFTAKLPTGVDTAAALQRSQLFTRCAMILLPSGMVERAAIRLDSARKGSNAERAAVRCDCLTVQCALCNVYAGLTRTGMVYYPLMRWTKPCERYWG
jgi:hypothetical protein